MANETQLTLPLCPPTPASFEQFISDEANSVTVRSLRHFLTAPNETLFFIAGEEGSGKTHLLTAACAEIERLGARGAYAPLAEAMRLSPELLSDWEQYDLVCLDDLHAIAGRNDWEETIFHLFNRARDTGHRLLISATRLPALIDIELPDLRSRLQWGTSFRLRMPDDALKRLILQNHAHQRGMHLNDQLTDYLLRHHDRNLSRLMYLLERLDKVSLARQRRLTLPFVRSVIADMASERQG